MAGDDSAVDLGILGLSGARLLGRGGFGSVYRAEEPALHRSVAVKVLAPLQGDESARVDRELRALGMLGGHPHIVMVHGTGLTSHGAPYIVMELMTEGSLGDRLESRGPLSWSEVTAIGVQIAGALETAHRAGILHRDLKPENILVSSLGEVKLADFGIARVDGGTQTKTGTITTSLAYAAPEILAGRGPSAASDVYGLAAALFSLLTGSSPFVRSSDDSLLPMINRIASEPAPDLRPRGVPGVVCEVLERALAKDPALRPVSALVFARELQAAQLVLGVPVTSVMVEGEADVVRSSASTPVGPPAGATVVVQPQSYQPQSYQPQQPPPQQPQQPPPQQPYQPQQPGYSPYSTYPTQAPKKGGNKALLIGLGAVAVVVVLGVVGIVAGRGGDDEFRSPGSSVVITVAPAASVAPPAASSQAAPGFKIVTDDSGRISMQVPVSWVDVDGNAFFTENGSRFAQLRASPNLSSALTNYDVSGVVMILVDGPEAAAEADGSREAQVPAECTFVGTSSTLSSFLIGRVDEYTDCDGIGTTFYAGGLTDVARSSLVVMSLQITADDRAGSPRAIRRVIEESLRIR